MITKETEMIPNTDLFNALKELQSLRKATIKMQIKMNNSCKALVARFIGYQPDMEEEDREKKWRLAGKIIKLVEKNKPIEDGFSQVIPFIKQNQNARSGYDAYREGIEAQMVELTLTLPYAEWFISLRGFTAMTLARILGESGDLLNYANPGKLWKRFALHVHKGHAPSSYKCSKWVGGHKPDSEEWIEISNVSQRRAEIYSIVQISAIQCGNPEYKAIYDDRKLYENERNPEIKPIHAHKRAHRYVAKRILKDLWKKAHGQREESEWIHTSE